MKNEKLVIKILRELAHEAALIIIAHGFKRWRACYYRRPCALNFDSFEEAGNNIERLQECLGKEDIDKIFGETEEYLAAKVGPQDWALFKKKAEPADQPVAGIADDLALGLEFLPPLRSFDLWRRRELLNWLSSRAPEIRPM
jgi:hypothetical protein